MPFLIAVLCALSLLGQPVAVDEKYIEDTFQARIGEVPKLGWYDQSRGFLATQSSPQVTVYGPIGVPASGKKTREISGADILSVRRRWLACELTPEDTLSVFDVPGRGPDTARALYTDKKLPGQSRSGLISVPLDDAGMAAVNRALGWPASGVLRRDEAIATRSESFFYSLHKLYSSSTGLLRQEAIILHGRAGQIIALDLRRNLDTADYCDGCPTPSYLDERVGVFRPLNVFEFPGFPYPLVLLDTGTIEGQALSLLTFTPTGKLAEFREYEYVVNCIPAP